MDNIERIHILVGALREVKTIAIEDKATPPRLELLYTIPAREIPGVEGEPPTKMLEQQGRYGLSLPVDTARKVVDAIGQIITTDLAELGIKV